MDLILMILYFIKRVTTIILNSIKFNQYLINFIQPFVIMSILILCQVNYSFLICFQAHAIGIRGDEQGLGVKINRIVLQTLTFTSGT
ncbi:MAG TPA: hypothetical protein DDW27_01780 [Bacteroidales bacterium]|nr:hypothetical protein [Bacteroidales bacterium]